MNSDLKITNSQFQDLQFSLVSLYTAFYMASYDRTHTLTIENTSFHNISSLNSYSSNYDGNSLFYFSEISQLIFNNNTIENFSSNSYRINFS